ncbi:zinc finger and SCAN domain-containing protein 12-like [Uranotaenia lowii]|uniref:zinc finger and SCAN domain-containing protein 12-like n=1 Tax=Uranotaenia lowii TaxID=190385 RepID=UPI002479064F|nr:zinc finger and SCAN domain-containing protein 12-like [Uranotaenia lowii]
MNVQQLENACRLCLQEIDGQNIYPIRDIEDKIELLFKFELIRYDQESQWACKSCYDCVGLFYNFTEMVSEKQSCLETLFASGNDESGQMNEVGVNIKAEPTEIFDLVDDDDDYGDDDLSEPDLSSYFEPSLEIGYQGGVAQTSTASRAAPPQAVPASLACDLCTYVASNRTLYTLHRKRAHGPKVYKCQCGRSFSTNEYLTTHQKRAHQPKSFHCKLCDKSFAENFYLMRHQANRHRNVSTIANSIYRCQRCDKPFLTPNMLSRHQQANTCEVQRKGFRKKYRKRRKAAE